MSLKRTRFMALVIMFFVLSYGCISLAAEDSKSAFDRYQSLYKTYQEAVMNQADKHSLERMAGELQAASRDYYRSIGVNVTFDAENPTEPVISQNERQDDQTVTTRVQKSALQKQYDQILSLLGSPDRVNKLADIQKQLEDFLKTCTDEVLQKEAVFQLAEVVYERTASLSQAQNVLLSYAKATRNAEFRRQAMARIKVLKRKSVVA
ncbi:MAG TPA: hypothetical protein DCG57_02145, partial [Candidatus Riflebacteria bacterium]|nr:hypothetical protein [Candidatus Riflebacteria bacterium]